MGFSINKFRSSWAKAGTKVKALYIILFIGFSIFIAGGINWAINYYTNDSDNNTNNDDNNNTNNNNDNNDNNTTNNGTESQNELLQYNIEYCKLDFVLTAPNNTPQTDTIYMRTDIGTGLDEQEVEFSKHDDNGSVYWITSLNIPKGKIFYYRYARNMNWSAEETYLPRDGHGMHRRAIAVVENTTIYDHIVKWEDLPLVQTDQIANISGRIIDSTTKAPIMNVRISAGPYQTISGFNGSFEIKSVPTGNLSISVFTDKGDYKAKQMDVFLSSNETKDLTIELDHTTLYKITFNVSVPAETPDNALIKIFGNNFYLGGRTVFEGTAIYVNTIPSMTKTGTYIAPDNSTRSTYSYSLYMGNGTYLAYFYTLGDMFIDREFDKDGHTFIREICVNSDLTINNSVFAWKQEGMVPVVFNITSHTDDPVSITTDRWGGYEPIQMWNYSNRKWTYTLYTYPNTELKFKFLRYSNTPTGYEKLLPNDANDKFRNMTVGSNGTYFEETIDQWRYMLKENISNANTKPLPTPIARASGDPYQGGVELIDYYTSQWDELVNSTLQNIAQYNTSWVQIAAVWGILQADPVIIDYGWNGIPYPVLIQHIRAAKNEHLNVSIRAFAYPADNNYFSGFNRHNTYAWYDDFFKELLKPFMYYAKISEDENVDMLILPNFNWYDDTNDTMTNYIDQKWNETIDQIRSVYHGKITIDYYVNRSEYNWYAKLDYLGDKWWTPLATNTTATFDQLKSNALDRLNNYYASIVNRFNKSIIFAEVAYYSANTSAMQSYSVFSNEINEFQPENDSIPSNWTQQALVYEAVLHAFAETNWVQGSYSFGYFYFDMDCKGYSIR
ncbi:MAG: glycoside hydrolase family 113, partial [Promethearchaeota archaeon]